MKNSKRIIISSAAVVAALGVGGGVWASTAGADVGSGDRDRAGNAAVQAVGGGTVLDVEADDDNAYEVEVRKPDGTEVEVALDKNFAVVSQKNDTEETGEETGAEARALTDAERVSVEQAARTATGGGTVTDIEASDKPGVAFEAEVRDQAGADWDVDLDAAFTVLTKTADS
ncbi:PepSY domain-containing protein [Catenuloplanes sp. NPDC051500]|uniref:PepSY domain-containing protein n=1 Tax=Catenuloplanes sp. NPDC051500 TaxID=3363959 RepID=UPI0037B5D963